MSGIIILGAGLAGLGCARHLPGARVFEAQPHPGGHAYSHPLDGVYFDEGAHICHARDPEWLATLYRHAGAVEKITESKVANYWHSHWVTYPVQNHLRDLPVEDRIAALSDLMVAQARTGTEPPAHYRAWLESQYGTFITERFYAEYTAKYWRVPMDTLGTDWLGGRLLPSQLPRIIRGAFVPQREEQSVFAAFHYPARGGFYAFFAPFAQGLDITCQARACRIDTARRRVEFAQGQVVDYDRLATSIPLPELVAILPEAPAAVREAAARLRCTQLLCVNLLVRRPALCPYHWFYIYDPDIEVARVKVNSNVAPHSVPEGVTALQCEIFRRQDEVFDINRLVDGTIRDLGRLLGFTADEVRAAGHVQVKYAYPISDLMRASAVQTIVDWLHEQRIYPMGLFGLWRYLWSDAAFRSGEETARRLLAG